ncbi:MAG: NUDIX domain-containing protein [Lachnospiraceae bacterium]|nr:NUDIX domain-containing protein [Lachnospiraceae bacterium]
MKFMYCPHCGAKLAKREIGDEGLIPYCEACRRPWFDMPYACTITLVINEFDEVALIRQGYVSEQHYVCVAGYIKCGESAEETATREVKEELGLEPESVRYTKSYYFVQKDMLMLAFEARVKKDEFHLSGEVDKADWFTFEEAHKRMRKGSIAIQLLENYFGRKGAAEQSCK